MPTNARARSWSATVVCTRSRLATAVTLVCASAVPRGPSASAARSWYADLSTSIASTSSSRAISRRPTRTSGWATWPAPENARGWSPSSGSCGARCCCSPKPNDRGHGHLAGSRSRRCALECELTEDKGQDPFAHLKQRASERADRTVERIRAGIAALLATDQKITAESLKQVTRELEPGFAGLSFQVIRRNQLAYALYREAADAFSAPAPPDNQRRKER